MARQLCLLAALLPLAAGRMLSDADAAPAAAPAPAAPTLHLPPAYQADLCSSNHTAAAIAAAYWWSDPANMQVRAQGKRFDCASEPPTAVGSIPFVFVVAFSAGVLGFARLTQLALRRHRDAAQQAALGPPPAVQLAVVPRPPVASWRIKYIYRVELPDGTYAAALEPSAKGARSDRGDAGSLHSAAAALAAMDVPGAFAGPGQLAPLRESAEPLRASAQHPFVHTL